MLVQQILTHSPLFNLPCRDAKNRENLDHYLNDYIHHFCSRRQFCIDLETPEKHLNPLKDVDKSILARTSILSCLRGVDVRTAHTKLLKQIHTERRMPIPANIAFAGENTCKMNMNMSMQILDKLMSGGIPDQHQLQESKTEYREHSRWDQAILTTVHRH